MKSKAQINGLILSAIIILLAYGLFRQSGVPLLAQTEPEPLLQEEVRNKIAPQVLEQIQRLEGTEEMITVIVELKSQVDLSGIQGSNKKARRRKILKALRKHAKKSQKRIKQLLREYGLRQKVRKSESFWVLNGLSVTATGDVVTALASLPEVRIILPNSEISAPPVPATGSTPEVNISLVNAPALWDLGYRGQGVLVASLDTGVDLNHPDLTTKWRGGTNSWFDPYGENATPVDVAGNSSGHGTGTMGIIVGGDAGGTAIGVAPDAQWIAAKIFNNQGSATTAAIHAAYQWVLDPDNDPNSDDAPDIVNNSWTFQAPGCDLQFQADLQALRASGILPIFSAGNAGPGVGSSVSPPNNPEAFAVGAVDNNDQIYNSGSRGPSSCGEPQNTFPEMVAPGVNVRSSDRFGLYQNATGTSLAAPHAAGGLALLLSFDPALTVEEQENALINGAIDLGPIGPDDEFGHGRLDLLASYQWLQNSSATNTPTATTTSTPLATLTATPTITLTATTTNTSTATPTATATNTPTVQPTATATSTPAATPTSTPATGNTFLYLSSTSNVTIGGTTYRDEDILRFDLGTSTWTLFLDGSDIGLSGTDVDAFALLQDGSLLLSLSSARSLANLGLVDDSDILRFVPTSTGSNTSGTLSLYLDASDVNLASNGEDIDSISLLDDGRIILSTVGSFNVGSVSGKDEDLLAFTPSQLGENSSGTWQLYFDGSDVGLHNSSSEDTFASWVDNATGDIYLSSFGSFSVSGVSGDGADIFICTPISLGTETDCTFSLFWDGSAYGFAGEVLDALHVDMQSSNPTPTNTPISTATATATVTNTSAPQSTATATATATATNTSAPQSTATATNTPTVQPTATATSTPAATPTSTPATGNTFLYLSSTSNVTIGGTTYRDEDILRFDLGTSTWTLFLDGSDIGLSGTDVDAFALLQDGSLLLSLSSARSLANLGLVDDSDILRFVPTSTGSNTSGTLSLYLDASDVNLASNGEDIDSISLLDDGRIILSTVGSFNVGSVSGKDEDLLAFTPSQLGENSSGTWQLYFDGSDVGLHNSSSEDTFASWVDNATGDIYLSSFGSFSVSGVSGDGADIFICTPISLGTETDCTFSLFWDGSAYGFAGEVLDALHVENVAQSVSSASHHTENQQANQAGVHIRIHLPLVQRE